MPQLCTGSVKEILNHTLSDVIIAGAGGSFACFPSDRAKLFAVPSSFSLCSSAFINGVLLGGGTCDASFIIHGLRFKFLATAARPYVMQAIGGNEVCLGVDPAAMPVVLLIAQLLTEQIRISFEVQERTQICQFGNRFPGGGGLWADLAGSSGTGDPCVPTPTSLGLWAVLQNGIPSQDNVYTLDQPIGVGNGQSVGAVIEFDTVTKADGNCFSVLDLLSCQGNSAASCPTSSTPASCVTPPGFAGILIKGDFQVDGLLCRAVC